MVLCAMAFSLILLGCKFPREFACLRACKADAFADMKSGLGYHMWDVQAETYMNTFQVVGLVLCLLHSWR